MKRIWFGVILSILWVLISTSTLLINGTEPLFLLKPNEWGDVLAGMTAPLAFIWLVIGYFQQGEELKKNTKALRLQEKALNKQTEELKVSVSHQAEIVKLQEEELAITLEKNRKELKPDLVFETTSAVGNYEDGFKQIVKIKNIGHNIYTVYFSTSDGVKLLDNEHIGHLYKNKEIELNFQTSNYYSDSDESVLSMEHTDGAKERWVTEYRISFDRDTGFLSFEKELEWD